VRLPLPSTLRWRLTLWYTVLLGAPLIAFAIGGYLLFAHTLYDRADQYIADALTPFSREIVGERRIAAGVIPAMRRTAAEVRFRDLHIAILDSTGSVVAEQDPQNPWIAAALAGRDQTKTQVLTVARPDGDYRVMSTPLTIDAHRFALSGSYALDQIEEVLERVRNVFAVAIPLLIVCAAAGGYVVTARSIGPVSSMAARAAEISTANLAQRLPVGGSEEVARLAQVVNLLLDRLEASFALQRRFMADASHELRTPTAIIRTEADVTLSQPHRSEEAYRASIAVVRDAARRLTRIVDDLFLLARSDAGSVGSMGSIGERRELVHLDEVIQAAIRVVHPLAAEHSIQVRLLEFVEAPLQGDADQLGRLMLNLLHNAIKHSPDGGTVAISLARRGNEYQIGVVDAGAGIPIEAQPRVFERFFRVDPAREAGAGGDQVPTSGAGLGLSIARRIAELHGGNVVLAESRPGRTEFRVAIPLPG
jgi:heavy metal sensor kinase